MTKPTQAELIQAHFQAGGQPLSNVGIAGLLDVSFARASSIISELEASPMWAVRIENKKIGPRNFRLITSLEPNAGGSAPTAEQVADHLRAHPDLSANALAMAVGCGRRMAERVRRELIEAGEIHKSFVPRQRRVSRKQPKRAATGRKGVNHSLTAAEQAKLDAGWIVPTGRPKCDEPHLARAVRFRQLWPMNGRAV